MGEHIPFGALACLCVLSAPAAHVLGPGPATLPGTRRCAT
jgi:hypothetical protein